MMQIKRETDYAVRCVYYLAGKPDQVTMVDEVAREMAVPRTFLAKILQKLTKAGIVMSHKGVKGGFQLSRRPEEISIYDVVAALEGPVVMNVCTISKTLCSLSGACKVHPFWVEVRSKIEELLKGIDFGKIRAS